MWQEKLENASNRKGASENGNRDEHYQDYQVEKDDNENLAINSSGRVKYAAHLRFNVRIVK